MKCQMYSGIFSGRVYTWVGQPQITESLFRFQTSAVNGSQTETGGRPGRSERKHQFIDTRTRIKRLGEAALSELSLNRKRCIPIGKPLSEVLITLVRTSH